MSSAAVLVALPFLLQTVGATFPPVINPPPIPGQAVRTLDISGQRVYVQDDIQPNIPQTVIKEESYFQSEPKIEDQRLYIAENQSGETGDFPSSTEAFDRYYSSGFVGPVATPLPDDNYVAQPSGTSKILPEAPGNIGSSDIWVLTKGPNDQYVPERWIQVPVSDDRVVEVVNQEASPKVISETINAFPPPPLPIKTSGAPIAPANVQQIWIKAPPPQQIQSQKIIQNTPTIVEEIPPVKQYVDVAPPVFKQYTQPQIIKEAQPLLPPPPPAPVVSKSSAFIVPPPPAPVLSKSSTFVVPPPPPPPLKSIDIPPPKQTVFVNQPVAAFNDKSGGIAVGKTGVLPQVKHIWIPTSQQTGKFITVPVGTVIDGGKSIQSKGVPMDVPPPVAVSDTWVLKQDGPVPRFEQQKSFAGPFIQSGNTVVAETPVLQFESPKNPPLIGKTIDAPADIWPVRKGLPDPKVVGKAGVLQPAFPPPPPVAATVVKSDGVLMGKTISQPPVLQQKTYISAGKGQPLPLPLPPPPAIVAPVPQVVKGKPPCPPTLPQKSIISPKSIPVPAYRTVAAINRQPFTRIIRLNRFPYGSYYVLNPRMGPSLYNYPRPVVQQAKNGVMRLVSARQLGVPFPVRQVAVQVPRRQAVLPLPPVKSISPVVQPKIVYPPLQAVSRLRYSYPWGSYLRSLPIAGKNVFALPPSKPARIEASSSSSSSSSESSSSESSSESKSAESKPKEIKKEIESEAIVSDASEPEPEKEPVEEQVVSESAPEEVEAEAEAAPESAPESVPESAPEEPETPEIMAEESQLHPQVIANQPINTLAKDIFEMAAKPYMFGIGQRDRAGANQPRKEVSDAKGRVVGTYAYRDNDGSYRNVRYVADEEGYRAHVVRSEPGTVSQRKSDTNFIPATESTTAQFKDPMALENFSPDIQRD